jgi:hypothetical protein
VHPTREQTCAAASSAAFLLATALLACQTRMNGGTAKPGRANPRFWGSEKVEKSLRNHGRVECASKLARVMNGAGVQVRGAKRDGDERRRRACGAWSVKPSGAARRKPQASTRACGT